MSNNERQQQIQELSSRLGMNSCQISRSDPKNNFMARIQKVVAYNAYGPEKPIEIQFRYDQIHGSGAFGTVFTAYLISGNPHKTHTRVAVKQFFFDKRFKNRELPIMRHLNHCNIVSLLYYFYSPTKQIPNGSDLNLMMEFMPETVASLIKKNFNQKKHPEIPIFTIKLLMYQIFRALAFIHSKGICHRDIKPNNLLIDLKTGVLKVCDFGSAKQLLPNEKNVTYICSRYYRAPELLFGATNYSNMIDMWSAGCVFSELLLLNPMFIGSNSIDQLVKIIEKLGTPSKEQINEMNSIYTKYDFPQIRGRPLQLVFPPRTPPDAIDLLSKLFEYKPSARIRPLQACAHPFFNELRDFGKKWTNREPLPPLFNFTQHELNIEPQLNATLIPNHRLVGDGSNQRTIGVGSTATLSLPENLISKGLSHDFINTAL